ncbi:MAG TPA: chromosomal replication initiator protein DnaA [Dehalococcoidia bacterium]|nr:chromosomal replication initiator protein DnaA [Dehalococcoidia bacterium]
MENRSAQEIWDAALGELQIQVSKPNFRTWLERTVGLSYQDNHFVISVPNTFVAEYLDKNQRSLIEKTLINLTSSPDIKVTFQVDGRFQNSSGNGHYPWPENTARFNSNYLFDSFVVGDCNRLAYAAAQGVAQNPGRFYNPLYIYGGVGLGKTHLLHAIGHLAQARHIPVICVSAEEFTNEFLRALHEHKTDEFHQRYRNTGMLLIDDIHFICGKKQTEESFFHTFNALHNANRQVVVTSDRPPKAIPFLDKRLRSRFEWGLVVDIQPPDQETRLAILEAKAKERGAFLPQEVLEFIAQRPAQNIRELEGSLNRVIAYAKLLKAPPTAELAAQALEDLADKEPKDASSTPELVIAAVAESFRLSPSDLQGQRRDKETVLARRVAMYLLRQETGCSLAQIGQLLGGRDPSAVTNACKKITLDLKGNLYLKRKIEEVKQKISPESPKKRG